MELALPSHPAPTYCTSVGGLAPLLLLMPIDGFVFALEKRSTEGNYASDDARAKMGGVALCYVGRTNTTNSHNGIAQPVRAAHHCRARRMLSLDPWPASPPLVSQIAGHVLISNLRLLPTHYSLFSYTVFERGTSRAAMQSASAIVFEGFAVCYLFLRLILYLTQDVREPPAILTSVPFFGPLVGMFREKSNFHLRLRSVSCRLSWFSSCAEH